MLQRMKNKGFYTVTEPSYFEMLSTLKKRLNTNGHLDTVVHFLEEDMVTEESFSCATKYPMTNKKAWEGPLKEVFEASGKDVTTAGYFLGLLVMEIIIDSDEKWWGTTTNISKREFETMFYWRDTR